ncbi:MAG TPA: Uma2 family endonuclease [Pyrinomonadaceae bacterium]|nr:Uma2 family endonuclease [Pyrinomonadaceae bacterium]
MSTTTTHLMTAEELANMPDDGLRHELIKGELLTMPVPMLLHGFVTMNLSVLLYNHIETNNHGLVVGESGFHLETGPDTVLGPDVAFIARDRVGTDKDCFYPGAPDLAVEVLSSSDRRGKVERKTALWLELGAKSVWNVDPRKRTVEVFHADGTRWLLQETDELADDIVPGFRVAVSKIFE